MIEMLKRAAQLSDTIGGKPPYTILSLIVSIDGIKVFGYLDEMRQTKIVSWETLAQDASGEILNNVMRDIAISLEREEEKKVSK